MDRAGHECAHRSLRRGCPARPAQWGASLRPGVEDEAAPLIARELAYIVLHPRPRACGCSCGNRQPSRRGVFRRSLIPCGWSCAVCSQLRQVGPSAGLDAVVPAVAGCGRLPLRFGPASCSWPSAKAGQLRRRGELDVEFGAVGATLVPSRVRKPRAHVVDTEPGRATFTYVDQRCRGPTRGLLSRAGSSSASCCGTNPARHRSRDRSSARSSTTALADLVPASLRDVVADHSRRSKRCGRRRTCDQTRSPYACAPGRACGRQGSWSRGRVVAERARVTGTLRAHRARLRPGLRVDDPAQCECLWACPCADESTGSMSPLTAGAVVHDYKLSSKWRPPPPNSCPTGGCRIPLYWEALRPVRRHQPLSLRCIALLEGARRPRGLDRCRRRHLTILGFVSDLIASLEKTHRRDRRCRARGGSPQSVAGIGRVWWWHNPRGGSCPEWCGLGGNLPGGLIDDRLPKSSLQRNSAPWGRRGRHLGRSPQPAAARREAPTERSSLALLEQGAHA